MGTPYQRQDVSNNISNGNIIDASDLDAEFNALEAAFALSTGHSHDGTAGEGGPITVVGPAQDLIVSGTQVLPKTNNTLDLGAATFKFKDAYVDGIAYLDGINFNGTAITATGVEINRLSGVTSGIQTQLNAKQPLDSELTAIAGLTSAADTLPYFTGSGTAALATFTAAGRALVDDADATAQRATLGLGSMATQNSGTVTITGGSITGITDLAVADGGTGVSTLTGLVKGNGTAPFSAAVAGTDFLAPAAIGVTVQAYDAELQAISGLVSAANQLPYFTGSGTAALTTLSAFGRTLIDDADATAARTTLGAQASDAALTSLAGLSLAAGDVLYATGADTLARLPIGTAGQVLRVNAGATAPEWTTDPNITWLSPQATTSGQSVVVLGIPSTATEVFVSMEGNSLSGADNFLIQLGHSGGIISTGYLGYCDTIQSTSGFPVFVNGSARVVYGTWQFRKPTGNLWLGSFVGVRVGVSGLSGGGQVDLSANVLDRIRIESDGIDTLDGGAIRVGYR